MSEAEIPMVPRAPQIIRKRPRVTIFLSPPFCMEEFGSPLFIVNKSASLQYGRLKVLNKESLGLKVTGNQSILLLNVLQ